MKKLGIFIILFALIFASGCGTGKTVETGKYVLNKEVFIEVKNFKDIAFTNMDTYFKAIQQEWLSKYKDLADADKEETVNSRKLDLVRDLAAISFETNKDCTAIYIAVPNAFTKEAAGAEGKNRQLSITFAYSAENKTIKLDLKELSLGELVFTKA